MLNYFTALLKITHFRNGLARIGKKIMLLLEFCEITIIFMI